MNTIWWDEASGQVCISSLSQTFPPRTLIAHVAGDEVIVHRRMGGNMLISAPPEQYAHRDGSTFSDCAACVSFLNDVFDRMPGSSGIVLPIADEALSGHRMVRTSGLGRVAYASCDTLDHAEIVIGLTRTACDAGSRADIATQGAIEEPSWSWEPGPLFLGLNGLLTPTPPASGFVLRVATVLAPTRILLVRDEPYVLAS